MGSPSIKSDRCSFLLRVKQELALRQLEAQIIFSPELNPIDPISTFQEQLSKTMCLYYQAKPPSILLSERSILEYELLIPFYPEFFKRNSERFRNLKFIINEENNASAKDICNKYDFTFFEINSSEVLQITNFIEAFSDF